MKNSSTPPKRAFVSPSARQRRQTRTIWARLSGVVHEALRDLDTKALAWPTELKRASCEATVCDDLCTAYRREAAGAELWRDRLVRTYDHALLVVGRGDLVIESAQCPFAVQQGDSAIVPAGWWRLTELPAPHSAVSYWIIFFGPGLIQAAIGKAELVRQMAMRVAPVFCGVYVQRGLVHRLALLGHDGPVPDVLQSFRALGSLAGASFFMFLGRHYYNSSR